jgi:MerR family transcriptional regulator, light-induced transcriptional regulator
MTATDSTIPRHPIQVAAGRTGLSPDVLRAWERRYGAVNPARTETGRRLYSDADLERLEFLREATEAGRSISQVAAMSRDDLAGLVADDRVAQGSVRLRGRGGAAGPSGETGRGRRPGTSVPHQFVQDALDAVLDFDAAKLRRVLASASVALSQPDVIEDVVVQLMLEIGERWRDGTMRTAHEHMATAVVQTFLGELTREHDPPSVHAPTLVVGSPSGQHHQLGAMMAASTAMAQGWKVVYLGGNIPLREVASVVRQVGAAAVALSITYPAEDPQLHHALIDVRTHIAQIPILVGGRAARGYRDALEKAGATMIDDLKGLQDALEAIRSR